MHLKTRGKGPALIMGIIEDTINGGLIPANVHFRFLEQDLRSESEKANARFTRAKDRAMRLKSGELDAKAARQLAIDDGDLPEWLAGEIDLRGEAEEQPDVDIPEEDSSEFGATQVMSGIESHEERD